MSYTIDEPQEPTDPFVELTKESLADGLKKLNDEARGAINKLPYNVKEALIKHAIFHGAIIHLLQCENESLKNKFTKLEQEIETLKEKVKWNQKN